MKWEKSVFPFKASIWFEFREGKWSLFQLLLPGRTRHFRSHLWQTSKPNRQGLMLASHWAWADWPHVRRTGARARSQAALTSLGFSSCEEALPSQCVSH